MTRVERLQGTKQRKIMIIIIISAGAIITAFSVGSMIGYRFELSALQEKIVNHKDIPYYAKEELVQYYEIDILRGNN